MGSGPVGSNKKDHKIGICCFSAKLAALSRKSKDGLAQNPFRYALYTDEPIFLANVK